MKKIISLAFALTCFFSLVSCEGEEEVDYVIPNYVASTWEVTQVGALNSQSILNYEDVNTACALDRFVFNDDFTFSRVINDASCVATTTTGTYALVDGNIVLTYTLNGAEKTESLDILTLTNTELSVAYTDTTTQQLVFLKMKRVIPTED